MTETAGLLVSGRALRADSYLHLDDQKSRQAKAARRVPRPGQRGSRRWRRHRARVRRAEACHRRHVHQAQHQAAKQVIAFAVHHQVGTLVVGDLKGITNQDAGGCRTSGCGSGAAPTCSKPCATRLSKPGSWCGWWMSVAPPPPVPPAGGGSPSPRAGGSAVPIAPSRGTGIWSVPTTSPRRLAADLRARTCLCSSSTVGPASCRHGVTDAATSTTSGGVGPAWPRATHRRSCVPWVSLATRPRPGAWRGSSSAAQQGKRCLKGH